MVVIKFAAKTNYIQQYCNFQYVWYNLYMQRGWNDVQYINISSLCKGNKCFIPPGQRFGEFCQMKSFRHLCLQNHYSRYMILEM
jgi:hypothetical protein